MRNETIIDFTQIAQTNFMAAYEKRKSVLKVSDWK